MKPSSPRAASRDPVLASGKSGPIPTFPPNSHVGSHRSPTCSSLVGVSRQDRRRFADHTTSTTKVRRVDFGDCGPAQRFHVKSISKLSISRASEKSSGARGALHPAISLNCAHHRGPRTFQRRSQRSTPISGSSRLGERLPEKGQQCRIHTCRIDPSAANALIEQVMQSLCAQQRVPWPMRSANPPSWRALN